MSTKFFTNSEQNTLLNKFDGVFKYNQNIQYFDALVGYFRASGYFSLRPHLDKVPKIRILVGIDVDKLLAEAQRKGLEFFTHSENTIEQFKQKIQDDIAQADYNKRTEQGILQFIDDLITQKIEVKAHPTQRIHAKVYIFRPEPFNQHTAASVITGSSNLTDSGLGKTQQYEFNVQLSDYSDVQFATDEFERLWAESIDVLPVAPELKKKTRLDDYTPFELYIKLLAEYFGDNVDYNADALGDLPPHFKKLSYQMDAVNEGFNMLLKHNGFVLADVVGLGKTVIATMVAKQFLMKNGRELTKILVVYPPAVEKNWKDTFKFFDLDKHTKFITNGSLHKILDGHPDYWAKEEYDLILVDEAHKFRNDATTMFNNLELICKSSRANQGWVEGLRKRVILITATPLNNAPNDIFNQIKMFQDARQSTLPITNLTSFFAPLTEQYKLLKRSKDLNITALRAIYEQIRKNVIEPITIRRTRTDLENIEAYKTDLAEQGIVFPRVEPPKKMEYLMDEVLNALFYTTVQYLTELDANGTPIYMHYARYQAIAGLREDVQHEFYENAERAARSLAYIMQTQLIKRLESSFYAFKKSLMNFQHATQRMITMFEKDKIFIAPDTDVNKLLDKGWTDDEIEREIERLSEENPKNKTFKNHDFKPEFIQQLQSDKQHIDELVGWWQDLDLNDPKLERFMESLKTQFLHPDKNLEGKLVIFSESKETVAYLSKALQAEGRKDVLVISADNRKQLYDTIVRNFDANYDAKSQQNEFNILLTTEVLAEGVNLHRSNVIVHYDTPWNATRLMQRIGRVNRIGTKASTIYNYVFYPSAQGDALIQLNKTAFMKIQAFHTAFGEDNQVYSEDEILDEVKLFNIEAIREQEDERLKFLYFLRNFKKRNKQWFADIQALPLQARTCRDAQSLKKAAWRGGTALFLKTNRKFEFYWVNAEGQPNEIPPVEAFKIFEAQVKEKNVPLIAAHYDHIEAAIQHFEKLEETLVQAQFDPVALGPVAQRAKKFLSEAVKHPSLLDVQKQVIRTMLGFIETGKYNKLPTDVEQLQKKKLKLPEFIKELDRMAQRYSIVEVVVPQKRKQIAVEKPILIISESFE